MIVNTAITVAQWVTLLVSVILPAVVALVTAASATSRYKAVVLLVLSTVTGLVTQFASAVTAGTAFDLSQGLYNGVVALLVAVVAHYGLLKPTGLTGVLGWIQSVFPQGLGANPDD